MSTVRADGFPRALTSFVGRDREIDALSRLLSQHRLVTVTGQGGVGKTRLVAEAFDRHPDLLPLRVCLVELAAVTQPDLVPDAAAAALRVHQRTDRTVVRGLIEVLERDPTLLVLDNCEQVVAAVAALCDALLSDSDDVRILATSREPIGVPGEARLRLRPLPVDVPGDSPSGHADAVTLFADRVRLADPDFGLSTESTDLATRIVERLDGLPLAIELAAARCESLGLTQLLRRLDEPLTLLVGGARTASRRHRSLRDTVDWSYRLLDDLHRTVFRRISVFAGPFNLAAARAVGGDESAFLDLVDYSLLAPPSPGPDGVERYSIVQGPRAFALEKLERANERFSAERAMLGYYAAGAARGARHVHTAGEEAAAAVWFDAEDASAQQALLWALRHDRDAALRLATALAGWWQLRGRAVTGYRLLQRAAEGRTATGHPWADAQMWLGRLAQSTARTRLALEHFTAVCDVLRSGAPSTVLVDALAGQSGALRNLLRLTSATDAAQLALHLARQLNYAEGEAFSLTQLSLAADYAGDHDAALRYATRADRVDRDRLPDRLARRVALVLTISYTSCGEVESAQRTCAQGLQSARAAGDIHGQADFLYCAASLGVRTGDTAGAAAHLHESLRLASTSGDLLKLVGCLDECARLCALTGRPAEAVTLWEAARARAAEIGIPDLPSDAQDPPGTRHGAARALGAGRAELAARRGRTMNLHTATEFALLLTAANPQPAPDAPRTALTPRERELIALIARGRTDAQIAAELFISIRTVRSHLDRIRDKTGSRRRADLTRLALREGLA